AFSRHGKDTVDSRKQFFLVASLVIESVHGIDSVLLFLQEVDVMLWSKGARVRIHASQIAGWFGVIECGDPKIPGVRSSHPDESGNSLVSRYAITLNIREPRKHPFRNPGAQVRHPQLIGWHHDVVDVAPIKGEKASVFCPRPSFA